MIFIYFQFYYHEFVDKCIICESVQTIIFGVIQLIILL
jgi:hypothetical protein